MDDDSSGQHAHWVVLVGALLSGADDWTGLWELGADARDMVGADADTADILAVVLRAMKHLLERNLALVGDLRSHGFEPWDLSHAEILDRVEQAWLAASRDPNIGEICWLTLTPLGEITATLLIEPR